jgi:hypothetical protein
MFEKRYIRTVASTETNEYYGCDPFIPGAFAEDPSQISPRDPLQHFVATLNGDLRDSNGALIAPKDTVIVELGFVASLPPVDRDQHHIRRMLGDIAGLLRLSKIALDGRSIEPMDEEDLAFLRAPFQGQGVLPSAVIAHTRPDVAEIAVRDFNFEFAEPSNCVPESRVRAIQALGHAPVTVYMFMEQFLSIKATEF